MKYTERIKQLLLQYRMENPYLSDRALASLILSRENLQISHDGLRKKLRTLGVPHSQKFSLEPQDLQLPDSWYEEITNYILSESENRIAIINDVHIPFHSKDNLRTALSHIKDWGPTTLLLNGDIMDCYAVSSFARDPNYRDFNKEVNIMKQFLAYLREYFPDTNIYYKFGNHEHRLQIYLWKKAEELTNLEEIKLENLLQLYKYQIQHISSLEVISVGKLHIAHGHEILASAGTINVARNLRLKAFDNLIVGHFHRTQEDIANTVSGKTVGVWVVGCLCGLKPLWRPLSFWNAGFALIERDGDMFSVANKKIIHGKVL